MASWKSIEDAAPDFAAKVRGRFQAGTNKTLASLRADGAPRISATECKFEDGELTLGMMGGSRKLADVRRDPRVAIHSPTLEPPPEPSTEWPGEAKMAGSLVEIRAPDEWVDSNDSGPEGAGFFQLDITEASLTYLGGDPPDHLVIESWDSKAGWRQRTRT
jgi:Pyridoxamine 5'-phosphate oxidase